MKHNLPYLVNLPPFMLKDISSSELKGFRKILLILKGKILSFFIKKTKQGLFCKIINLFYSADGYIVFKDNNYIKVTKDGKKIYFPNKRILRVVKNYKEQLNRIYQTYCLNLIQIKDNDIVIDCGSNIGELFLSLEMRDTNVIYYGFEPDKKAFRCLNLNVKDKNFLFNSALSNTNKISKLYIDDEGGNSSLINFGSEESVEVNEVTLDSIDIKDKVKLFKVEAEGLEPEVLQGAVKTLKIIEFVSVDFGAERGETQDMTIVETSKILNELDFELVGFSEFRLIGLFKNTLI